MSPQSPHTEISRRDLFRTSALVGGSLVVSFFVPQGFRRFAYAQEAPSAGPVVVPKALPNANAFLRIGSDESVTVVLAHSEQVQHLVGSRQGAGRRVPVVGGLRHTGRDDRVECGRYIGHRAGPRRRREEGHRVAIAVRQGALEKV